MKTKKIAAAVLAALLFLSACENAETASADETQTTRQTETVSIIETVSETTRTETIETLAETTETPQTTDQTADEVSPQTADKNAEIIFDRAAASAAKVRAADEEPIAAYFDLDSLNEDVTQIFEKSVDNFVLDTDINEDIGGVYLAAMNDNGALLFSLWASSLESTVVGSYPEGLATGLLDPGESIGGFMEASFIGYVVDSATQTANAQAKLVFQYAATYMTKVQIFGAAVELENDLSFTYEGYYSSGGKEKNLSGILDLSENAERLPELRDIYDTIDDEDVQAALRYYMGGPNGGVAIILLDSFYNPVAVLWAKDENSPIVGAFPVNRTDEQNVSGNITTADIRAAGGLD
jgi:hypothetical protein